jgi:hypothetical protein
MVCIPGHIQGVGTFSRGATYEIIGRGGGIRTLDFLLPKQALYQAELRPVFNTRL